MPESVAHYLRYVQQLVSSSVSLAFKTQTNHTGCLAQQPRKCRFPLEDDRSDTITLSDGRRLGYAQYGSVTGKPIFHLHGLPGSRIEGAYYHDIGLRLGARIIAVDRPGIGLSSPNPDRRLLDFPKELEYLAQHLGLDEYAVVGVSGGGPYALACAAALPREKIRCVSIVCGLGPPDISMRGADLAHRVAFPYGWRYAPSFLTRWFWKLQPVGRIDLTDSQWLAMMLDPARLEATPVKDLGFMKDEDVLQVMLRSTRQAFSQGFDGVWRDGKVMCSHFGFRVEDIHSDLPVRLWYGKQDTFIPLIQGEQIAARLNGRAHLRVLDETHGSIFFNRREEVIEDILATMKKS
ncbi:Alpha/Beta hydrolase protein [Clohesyomyces aquaticus]|uniref:Alpha/Beta hydrolase protein n=1 Tax=Clohesyomyces aquaticus TaxID=1231657 RepID=A0A1Y1ZDX7_9PLEO|nr:Alpha/Beta hydrolase protein [Clohesyomyces aquaticus]